MTLSEFGIAFTVLPAIVNRSRGVHGRPLASLNDLGRLEALADGRLWSCHSLEAARRSTADISTTRAEERNINAPVTLVSVDEPVPPRGRHKGRSSAR
jgi:hypothetical protein